MKTKFYITIFAALLLISCSQKKSQQTDNLNGQPSVIFETDIGNDVDDAMALDMLYKYSDDEKINLLAICSNKDSKYSTEYIHLMNCWYGYPNIPIGRVVNGIDSENDAKKYAEHVSLMKNESGGELFERSHFDHETLPEAVSLYRKLLSNQLDTSVTIISVGFSTNIVRLLHSAPDQYSNLNGAELIARKVKLLSIMAASFGEKPIAEYNIVKDIPAAKAIADEWPTKIVFAPLETGVAVTYPAKSIENDFNWTTAHPVVEAYKYYLPMPYDRPTWDLIAVLYVVEDSSKYFTLSDWGKVTVDDKGYTTFKSIDKGKHAYLTMTGMQAKETQSHFVEMITKAPKSHVK